MKIRSLLLSAALIAAAAASAETHPVTAAWAMGNADYTKLSPTISAEGCFSEASVSWTLNFTHADGKTPSARKRTAKPVEGLEIPMTAIESCPLTKNENVYIEYTLTPTAAYTISSIELQAWKIKNGAARYDIVIINGEQTIEVATGEQGARTQEKLGDTQESTSGYDFSFNVKGFTPTEAPVYVRIYPYTSDTSTSRSIGFANVKINGTVGEAAELPKECTEHEYHIPGLHKLYTTHADLAFSGAQCRDGITVGWIKDAGSVTFSNVHATEEGSYKVLFPVQKHNSDAAVRVEVRDANGTLEAFYDGIIPSPAADFDNVELPLKGLVSKGTGKSVSYIFSVPGTGYVCDFRAPELVRTGEGEALLPSELLDNIPGAIRNIRSNWTYVGGHSNFGPEADGAVGSIQNGAIATGKIYATTRAIYGIHVNFCWYKNDDNTAKSIKIELIDSEGNVASATHDIPGVHQADILLPGVINPGETTVRLSFFAENGYVCNYRDLSFFAIHERDAEASLDAPVITTYASDVKVGIAPEHHLVYHVALADAAEAAATLAASESTPLYQYAQQSADGNYTFDKPTLLAAGNIADNSENLEGKKLNLTFHTVDASGKMSHPATLQLDADYVLTGVESIDASASESVVYYNLQGIRIDGEAHGVVIRVATAADGSHKATKVILP